MMSATRRPDPAPIRYFADFIEGRRGEILDAALVVFGEKGYEAGTMRAIAKLVGVTEPALYRHYESKEAIFGDIIATAGDRVLGEMRAAFGAVSGENVVPMLQAVIEMRRRSLGVKRAGVTQEEAPASAGTEASDRTAPAFPAMQHGAGGVLNVLMHAAPHNQTFVAQLRACLGMPMMALVRDTVPRVDASFGIERAADDLEGKVRVFMSLLVGYFTTSLIFDALPNDRAIVDALLAIMGWREQ